MVNEHIEPVEVSGITFRPDRHRDFKDYVVVMLDTGKLNAAWREDTASENPMHHRYVGSNVELRVMTLSQDSGMRAMGEKGVQQQQQQCRPNPREGQRR